MKSDRPMYRLMLAIAAALALVAAVACSGADDEEEPTTAATDTTEPATGDEAAATDTTKDDTTEQPTGSATESDLGYVPWTAPVYGPGEVATTRYDGPRPTKFVENPTIAELVRAGQPCGTFHGPSVSPSVDGGPAPCPAVEDRLPVPGDVLVLQPPFEIGVYGGMKRFHATGGQVVADLSPQGMVDGLDARIGKAVSLSEDGRTYTITLREGWKWSDGKPLDIEDFKIAWEEFNYNRELFPDGITNPPKDGVTGNPPSFEVVDDSSWLMRYDTPNVTLFGTWSFRPCWGCRGGWTMVHAPFFLQFHPKFADAAELKAQQEFWGVDDWTKVVFRFHPEFGQAIPVLGSFATPVADWRVGWGTKCTACPAGQDATEHPFTLANPFFGAVDPHGQQLPYMDGAETQIVSDKEVEVFRMLAGESDGPRCCWGTDVLPLWHENMEKANISIFSWVTPAPGTDATYYWHQDFTEDPEWGRLVRTLDFRRAMSLAVDREAINEGAYSGLGTVQQMVPHPSKPYHPGAEWASFELGPDKDAARALFKKMGYEDKDGDGWLDRLDGTGPLELDMRSQTQAPEHHAIAEFVKNDWEAIGIKVKLSLVDSNHGEITDGTLFLGGPHLPDREWTNNRASWSVVRHNVSFSLASSRYYYTGGEEGWAPSGPDPDYTDVYGNMAPEDTYPSDIQGTFIKLQDLHREARQLGEFDPRRIEMGKEFYRIMVENHYNLNIVAFKPNVGYVRTNVRNWLTESASPSGYGHNNELHFFEGGIDNANNPGNRSKKYKDWSFALQ